MFLSNRSKQTLNFGLQPADAWLWILGFASLTAVCLLLRLGQVVNYGFPAGAFLVSIYLYRKYPILYFSFALWIWFLCSLVRRMADFQSSWTNPSPILLAPLLVSFVSIIGLSQNFLKLTRNGGLPFILCAVSVIYGLFIGLINKALVPTVTASLGWFTPILLGLHLFLHWRDYPLFQKNICRTFIWGTFIVGSYGIYQYWVAPEWDKLWMTNVIKELGFNTIGNPEPLEIRVFSTLHGPQALGGMLMPGLILLLTNKSSLQVPATVSGYLSLLLSSARSAWVSWFVALLTYASSLTLRLRFRLILSFLIGILFLVPLITIEPFSTAITPRLETLSDVKEDGSVQDRAGTFNGFLDQALFSVVGEGLGDSAIGNDLGILVLFLSLGWIGSIPYLIGMLLAFVGLFQNPFIKSDAFASAALAISLGSFSQITTNVATSGIIGVTVWVFLGVGMAATKYHKNQNNRILHQYLDLSG